MLSWFVLKSGTVIGPISSEQVLSSYNNSNNMVWGVNCSEWLSFSEWSSMLNRGSFDVEVKLDHIPVKPKAKAESVEAKVFKIRPDLNEATVVDSDFAVEKTIVQNRDSEKTQVEKTVVDSSFVKPLVKPLQAKNVVVEKPKAPLPSIPQVDDIFPNDPVVTSADSNEFQDPEISDIKLNEQLTDFLQDNFIDNDGHTLIQATMDDLSHELEAENSQVEDGATKVQSLDLDDGFTKVQETVSDDGATKVQDFSLSLDDGFTKVQDSATEDSATKVQDFSLDLDDGFTKVQDSTAESDFFNVENDISASGGETLNSKDEPSEFFNMSDVENSSLTPVESVNEFNLDLGASEVAVSDVSESPAELSADDIFGKSEATVLELDSKYLEQDSNTKIQTADSLAESFPVAASVSEIIPVELEADRNLNSKIIDIMDLEKTNVADLKEIAQNIEQQKVLEKPIWYIAYDGESEGPMNVEALLKKLDKYENPEFIYLWRQGMQDWQNLYDTPQISSQLGIGFRRHDRYPFSGTVKIEFKGNTQIGQLENLSLSGIGATGFGPLVLGEIVKVTLDCAALDKEIEFVAEIRFTSDLGVLGLAYVKTQFTENVNKVIELVKSVSAQKAA